uniref:HAUS augmin like complex subunit 7 n=1 Tax=Latimeria chalumnae TaxID=7897 RepID=H3AZ05_LATCH
MAVSLGGADLAAVVYYKLKELGCPAVEGLYLREPDTMRELLCTPSVHRLDILEWILTRVYPPLKKQFCSLKESQIDVRIKEMAKLAHELMLCPPNDLDLLNGLASSQRQLSFLDQLLDIIKSMNSLKSSDSGDSATSSRKNEELLREIFGSPHLQSMLNPECKPWPSDMKLLLAEEYKSILIVNGNVAKISKNSQSKRILFKPKEDILKEVSKKLKETNSVLEQLKGEVRIKRFRLSVSLLSTYHEKKYLNFYDRIIQYTALIHHLKLEPVINPSPHVRTGPINTKSLSIYRYSHSPSSELQTLAQVTETSAKIVETAEQQQQDQISWGSGRATTLPLKVEELKRRYEEFQAMYDE